MKFSVVKIGFFGLLVLGMISFTSCQKDYPSNNDDVISLLREMKKNDSLLLISFKGLQNQVDSLMKVTGSNTSQLNVLKSTLDSVLVRLVTIQTQLNNQSANIVSIQTQLNQLLILYQSLLAQINNLSCKPSVADSVKMGLLAYYPFSGNAGDSSGNGNHGTISGVTLTTDRFGNNDKSFQFGTNKVINVFNPKEELNLTNSFSISSWIYMDSLSTSYNTSTILSKHDGDIGNDGWVMGIWNPTNDTLNRIVNFWGNGPNNTITYADSRGSIRSKRWYHLVVTYNANTKTLLYYLNNILIYNNSIQFQIISNTRKFTIGYQESSQGIYLGFFAGKIDDIRIYNKTLTTGEIDYLYKN
jgi:hypothetical protein